MREVVVHTEPGEDGHGTVRRLALDTQLSVLGVDIDLSALMADRVARPPTRVGTVRWVARLLTARSVALWCSLRPSTMRIVPSRFGAGTSPPRCARPVDREEHQL